MEQNAEKLKRILTYTLIFLLLFSGIFLVRAYFQAISIPRNPCGPTSAPSAYSLR